MIAVCVSELYAAWGMALVGTYKCNGITEMDCGVCCSYLCLFMKKLQFSKDHLAYVSQGVPGSRHTEY